MTKTTIKRILLSGATGFIGSHLATKLVNEGFVVGTLARKTSSKHKVAPVLSQLEILDADICDTAAVDEAFAKFRPDTVIHLATHYRAEHAPEDISLMINTNVTGTVNLLEFSRAHNVKLFVNTSSCFVYGDNPEIVTEASALRPNNLYAITKVQAEEVCDFYAGKYRLPCVTFRIFAPYGPGDHDRRLIPFVTRSLLRGESPKMSSGKQQWDFIYIDDIVEAYCLLLKSYSPECPHEIFNIGTGEAVSVHDIGMKIRDILKTDTQLLWGATPHRSTEIWHVCGDNTKAKQKLQWEPRTRILDDGLLQTVASIRDSQ